MRGVGLVFLLVVSTSRVSSGEPVTTATDKAGIAQTLKDMGLAPQSLFPNVWQVSLDREGWKVHVMVTLTPDGERIWLESKFTPIDQPDIVDASVWLKLLEANERISPAYFTFDRGDKRVHLYRAFDLGAASASRLKKEIDAFDAAVRRTQSLWRSENFSGAELLPVAPRVAVLEKKFPSPLEGKWRVVRIENKGESITEEKLQGKPRLAMDGGKAILQTGLTPERHLAVKIDDRGKPRAIDFIDEKGSVEQGIYVFEAGLLTICVAGAGEERPRQFITTAKERTWLLVLKKDE